jgi:hypothetical protein
MFRPFYPMKDLPYTHCLSPALILRQKKAVRILVLNFCKTDVYTLSSVNVLVSSIVLIGYSNDIC